MLLGRLVGVHTHSVEYAFFASHEHFGRDFSTQEVTRDRQRGMQSFPDQAGAAGYFQTHATA